MKIARRVAVALTMSIGVGVPVTTLLIYALSTPQGAPAFWENPARMDGWTH